MMNLNKLYVINANGEVTYYSNEHNRALAFNTLLLKKPWLDDKIETYEIPVEKILICTSDEKIDAKNIY